MKKIEELNTYIQENPDNDRYYAERAFLYYNEITLKKENVDITNSVNLGLKDITKAIELNPNNYTYYKIKGDLLLLLDDNEQAKEDFTKAIELEPNQELFYNRGLCFYNLEQDEQAIDDFTKAIDLGKDDSLTYNWRALSLLELKQYEQAKEDFTKAIELDPNQELFYNRALCFYNLKQYEQAIDDYTKAIDLGKDDSLTYNWRALSLLKLEQFEQAKEDFTKAIELDPNQVLKQVLFSFRALCFYNLKQYEQANEDITKAIDLGMDDSSMYSWRALSLLELEQYEQAKEDFTKAIELEPNQVLFYNRALCFYNLKQYEQANEDFTKAIDLGKDDSSTYNWRALSLLELKQYEQAKEDFTKAIELDPYQELFYNRALCFYFLKQYEQANEDITKAIDLGKDDSSTYGLRALNLFELEQYEQATEDLTKAIELDPKQELFSHRASCFFKLKQYEQAIDDYTKAISLDDSDLLNNCLRGMANIALSKWDDAYDDLKIVKDNWGSFISKQMPFYERGLELGFVDKNFLVKIKSPLNIFSSIISQANHEFTVRFLHLFFDLDKYYFFTDEFYKLANLIDDFKNDGSEYPQELKDLSFKLLDTTTFKNDSKDSEIDLKYMFKINIIKAVISKVSIDNHNKDLSIEEYQHFSNMQNLFTNVLLEIVSIMTSKIREADEEKAKAIIEAKIKERNEVIAKLSHSIKNLIRSAVIDPLSYMQSSHTLNEKNLSDALKGANLIREIANGINLSFKGSFEDFVYDAQNSSTDTYLIKNMFFDCFKYAVSNMLDGKYFNVFMREYFNDRVKYQTALNEWDKILQTGSDADIISFIRLNMLDIDFNFNLDELLSIGNEKGSAIKLLILFQEIIFNAVKYSSFVCRERRNILVNIYAENDDIVLVAENEFNPEIQAKSSGLGSVIIDNFAKLLSGTLDIDKTDNKFKLKLTFPNIWKNKGE